jgi:iron complex transport system substrate-binding protein
MQRPFTTVLVVVGLVLAGAGPAAASQGTADDCSFPVTVTDASGTSVTVEQEPESVVVLQPSAAQTMWEIGAQEKVVGMPKNAYTNYLNGTENKTNVVGERSAVLQEQVISLGADLVIAPNITPSETVASLRGSGQTVYYVNDSQSLEDVYQKTLVIGTLVGACDGAQRRTDAMRSDVESIRENVSDREQPKVLYALGGGFTAGNGTFIHELITAAGGENIAATAGLSGYATISQEVIIQQNPDWIVIPEGRQLPSGDAINGTTAIQQNQVVRVNDDYMNQPAPRNTIPLRQMAEAFYPDAFTSPTPTATATDDGATATSAGATTTPTPTATDAGTATPGQSGPGFTLVTALVAALAGALLARRR